MTDPPDLNGRRVALVMMSAIGDVVHALPLANSIRRAAPNVHLTWVIQPVPRQLLAGHPAVDAFLPFHRSLGWRAFPDFFRSARDLRFDLVLDPHVYFKAGLVTGLLRAPRKVGYDRARAPDLNWIFSTERIAPRPRAHAQDEMLEFVDHLGIPRVLEWRIDPTEAERAHYAELLPPADLRTAALVLASSKPAKDWPAERYLELMDHLTVDLGLRAVLIGGLSERENEIAATLLARATNPPLDLRAWDLRRVVYLLERCDVLITPDTGPLHIGVALGTPTVSLMGHTNPKRVGPYRFRELMIDAFGEPGEEYGPEDGYRDGRMGRITTGDVVEKVELALERYGPVDVGEPRTARRPEPARGDRRERGPDAEGR